MAICLECNGCIDNTCTECDDIVNPCSEAGCQQCTCTTPAYTNVRCPERIKTDCVYWNGEDEDCLPIEQNVTTLSTIITRLIAYIKGMRDRITSDSLVITDVDDDCDDKMTIEIVPSADADNIFTLGSDGYPYVPQGLGGGTPVDCEAIATIFDTDEDQKNTVDQTTYDFLITTNANCEKVSPPLGFAIAGPTRVSAFGPMEFYSTLALANADAVSGETVIVYQNTALGLVPVDGVNYFGVGLPEIQGSFITTNQYSGSITNIKFTGGFTNKLDSTIHLTNVISTGNAVFQDTSKTYGGRFIDSTKTCQISDTALVSGATIERRVGVSDGGRLNDFTIVDLSASSPGASAIFINPISDDAVRPSITNGYIYSLNHIGISIINAAPLGLSTISNLVVVSDGADGAYFHNGNINDGSSLIATNVTASSSVGIGFSCVSVKTLEDPDPLTNNLNWLVANCSGFSATSHGIFTINGNLKQCHGVSISGVGIRVGGSDNASCNNNITDCTGESKGSYALRCTRDAFIIGGTYITSFDDASTGNPIYISDSNDRAGYYIAGVKTWAVNTSAYAIKGTGSISARISGCQFLNQFLLTNVPGITGVTLRAVATDIYGNMR